MKKVLLLACFLICCANHAQEKSIESDSLWIKDYIRSPYGQDKIGMQFPLIEANDSDGEAFSSNATKKVTVYNFWFAGCAPCIAEIPMLMKLRDKYADKVDFIGISFDDPADILRIREKHKFDYRQLHINRYDIDNLRVSSGYPTTVIVCDGKIVYCKHGGPTPDSEYYDFIHEESFNVYSEVIEKYLK